MPQIDSQAWQQTLEQLVQREGTVEVAPLAGDAAEDLFTRYRARLFAFCPQGMLVERPEAVEAAGLFAPGKPLSVVASDGLNRWECFTEVVGLEKAAINAQTSVVAMRLTFPASVRSGQRRHFYRVATAGLALPPAVLLPSRHAATTAPTPPRAFNGTVMNIGGGGLGVSVVAERDLAEQFVNVRCYTCRLTLPTEPQPIEVPVRLVHLEPGPRRTFYLGLCFEFPDHATASRYADQICRFSAWHQRQQIQRQRQKR